MDRCDESVILVIVWKGYAEVHLCPRTGDEGTEM